MSAWGFTRIKYRRVFGPIWKIEAYEPYHDPGVKFASCIRLTRRVGREYFLQYKPFPKSGRFDVIDPLSLSPRVRVHK